MLGCLSSSLWILVTHRRTGQLMPPEFNTDRLPGRRSPIGSVCVESVRASPAAELGFRRAARFKSSIQSPCLPRWISLQGHAVRPSVHGPSAHAQAENDIRPSRAKQHRSQPEGRAL